MDPLPRSVDALVDGEPAAQWRLLAGLWAIGGLVAIVVGLVGAGPRADSGAVVLVGAGAVLAALAILAVAARLPVRWIGRVLVAGTTSVSLATVAAGAADTPFVLFYAWVGAEAWYFLSARGALAYTAYGIALSGAVAIALPATGGAALGWWLATAASLVAIGTMAAALRIRADRTITLLRAQAECDPLTGILNRRGLETRAGATFALARRRGTPVALVLADLDRFKAVNDRHGHRAGDDLLRAFAAACDAELRGADALARIGGEEFALLLPDTDAAGAAQVAERIRVRLQTDVRGPGGEPVSASFGVGAGDGHTDLEGLLDAADERLYAAKRAGRDRVVAA